LVLSDHPTPIDIRTHVNEPVPFAIYSSNSENIKDDTLTYSEMQASGSKLFYDEGWKLMGIFLGRS